MFGCMLNASNTYGSDNAGFESASFCPSFFAALLLLAGTAIAVSFFVFAAVPFVLRGLMVFSLVCVFFLRALLIEASVRRSKPLAA